MFALGLRVRCKSAVGQFAPPSLVIKHQEKMKLRGLTAAILLILVEKDVLSECPQSGCECGEFCVDRNNRWCNSNTDKECSCEKGCLVHDRMMNLGDNELIYCRDCSCPEESTDGEAVCSNDSECKPDNLTISVDYPHPDNESPNCEKDASDDESIDDEDFYVDIDKDLDQDPQ